MWLEYKYVWSIRGVMMDEGKVDGFQVEEVLWAAFAFVQPQKGMHSSMHIAGAIWRDDWMGQGWEDVGKGLEVLR